MYFDKYYGAIEDSMHLVQSVFMRAADSHESLDSAAAAIIVEYRAAGERLPGFGHRVHTADPRTARLIEMAEKLGLAGQGVAVLRALEASLAGQCKRLPVNVDGAIAGLLIDLNIPAELANAFFMIARVPGLIAQVHEEMTREKPMRRIHPSDHGYDGPPSRSVGAGFRDGAT